MRVGASALPDEIPLTDEELINRRDAPLDAEPELRGRALADGLGISEAQVLFLEDGYCVRVLQPCWLAILGQLRSLGTVSAISNAPR